MTTDKIKAARECARKVKELEQRNAELTELLATARDMMKQSHAMEVSALKKRNAELVEALRHYRGYASSISGMMGNMINTPTADRLRFVEQELNYIAAHSQEVFEDLGKAEDEEYAALDRNGGKQ